MSLFYGYEKEEQESFIDTGGRMRAPINMIFWALKNVPAPIDDFDTVSKKYMETAIETSMKLRYNVFHVFDSPSANVTKAPKTMKSNHPVQKFISYTPHSTSRLVMHTIAFDDDQSLPSTGELKIGIMAYRTDGTKKTNFLKKLDMQNVTIHTITFVDTMKFIVIQESFAFPDIHKDVFGFYPVLQADFTNRCEISLHTSVYDANPTFV